MKCQVVHELMPDVAAGSIAVTPEMNEHLQSCAACAEKLAEFSQTMALLDEWQVPESSPYFETRVMARVREEQAAPRSWLYWLRRPALAAALAVLTVMSVTLIRTGSGFRGSHEEERAAIPIAAPPGTAVGDLQALDKNNDLYSDFEVLDDLQVQNDVTANP